ncbi:ABC transporter permease [Homoserinibacter sp. YIM 151385]|uniref:ABC transporter permease n=1 Tax=Homoserinibacter sp. YIM 151385 TaxID=2985506 RepID=UPI0022F07874|nr:ABC transporter permease [Homoserinibacter sp. YIM 151385]WBU36842.1 ABC transporter permease [Homoserinibacter sp. YIM 151385]
MSAPASQAAPAGAPAAPVAALPRRFGAWYVTEHNLRRLKNYGGTIVATILGTPLLYLFAFGVGVATLVTGNEGPGSEDGVSYLAFVAPALLCAAAITVASEEFTYTIMMGFKWNPIFVGMNAAPISARQIVDGVVLFVLLRMLATALVYYLVMLAFGAVPSPAGGALAVLVAVLTGLAFGTPLMAYSASLTEDRGQFAMIMRFIVLPMTLFSGTMFPLETLPWFLQWVGWISPLWHGAELSRVLAYGAAEAPWLTAIHLVYLLALAVVGWRLAVRISTRRLDR